jgi:hypothetical protein
MNGPNPRDYDARTTAPPKLEPTRSPRFAWLIIILVIAAATLIALAVNS